MAYTSNIHCLNPHNCQIYDENPAGDDLDLIFRTSNIMVCTPKRYVRFLKDHIKVGASK